MEKITFNGGKPSIEKKETKLQNGILKGIFLATVTAGVVLGLGLAGTYTVMPNEQAVITRFGKPVRVDQAGIHFKIPICDAVHKYEKGILEWKKENQAYSTLDKKFIPIDAYAKWRIKDPITYMKTVQDKEGAQIYLDDLIYSTIREVVQTKKSTENIGILSLKCNEQIQQYAQKWGIEILEVRIVEPYKISFKKYR